MTSNKGRDLSHLRVSQALNISTEDGRFFCDAAVHSHYSSHMISMNRQDIWGTSGDGLLEGN